jgi:hypothetical protein
MAGAGSIFFILAHKPQRPLAEPVEGGEMSLQQASSSS